jgi:hypothetical protein
MRLNAALFVMLVLMTQGLFAAEEKVPFASLFIVTPMAGVVENEAQYSSGSRQMKLKENGPVQGINLLYARQNIVIGNLIHTSKTSSSNENGFLFFSQYYFNSDKAAQPMVGAYAEYITVYSQVSGPDSYPFSSLDVNTSVLALHPVAGMSFVGKAYRITPFTGYFNEQVESSVSSPGMRIAGQTRNGMKASGNDVLDYATLGSRFEFTMFHFVRFDTKFYYRFNRSDAPLLTTRNRVDIFLTKNLGLSFKYDYFQDKIESTTFTFLGPTFIF